MLAAYPKDPRGLALAAQRIAWQLNVPVGRLVWVLLGLVGTIAAIAGLMGSDAPWPVGVARPAGFTPSQFLVGPIDIGWSTAIDGWRDAFEAAYVLVDASPEALRHARFTIDIGTRPVAHRG